MFSSEILDFHITFLDFCGTAELFLLAHRHTHLRNRINNAPVLFALFCS